MPQTRLLAELEEAFVFAGDILVDAHATNASGSLMKPQNVRSFMTEAAVLKIFITWERYLEQSFLEYLMGSPSTTGASLVCYLRAPSIDHAKSVLVGTQRYVDWSNPNIVVRLADLYFSGGAPYHIVLSSIKSDLFDLRSIRNAAAHLSTTTSQQLDQLALRKLGRASTGVSVYDLVMSYDSNRSGKTILQAYLDILQAAATLISRG